jgi:hypothetical protein
MEDIDYSRRRFCSLSVKAVAAVVAAPILISPRYSFSQEELDNYQPTIYTRDDWGACEPLPDIDRIEYDSMDKLSYLVLHHTGQIKGIGTNPPVWTIQDSQMNSGKHSDIAYTTVFAKDGQIYEGRPWNVMGSALCPSKESKADKRRNGNLINGNTSLNYGVLNFCLIGDFTFEQPTDRQVKSLLFYIKLKMPEFSNISCRNIFGHKDYNMIAERRGLTPTRKCQTLCPGDINDVIDLCSEEIFKLRFRDGKSLEEIREEYRLRANNPLSF